MVFTVSYLVKANFEFISDSCGIRLPRSVKKNPTNADIPTGQFNEIPLKVYRKNFC